MSGYVTHSLWRTLRWVLVLTFVVPGCGGSGLFYRAYDGPELPLEEVAVVLAKGDKGVFIKRVDDREISRRLWWSDPEYHLVPGRHEVTLFYEKVSGNSLYTGPPITLSFDFEKGNVYHPEARFPGAIMIGDFKLWSEERGLRWSPEIIHDGTIEEVAPRRAKESFAPPHWRELAERQLASNPLP